MVILAYWTVITFILWMFALGTGGAILGLLAITSTTFLALAWLVKLFQLILKGEDD